VRSPAASRLFCTARSRGSPVSRERVTVAPSAGSPEVRKAIVERARRRGFSHFVLAENDSFEPAPAEEMLVRRGDTLTVRGQETAPVPILAVGDPGALDAALLKAPAGGVLAIEWKGDRVIPLENAIAASGRRFDLWVYARSSREVPGALGALEHGARRVIVEVRSPEEVDDLEAVLDGPLPSNLDWTLVTVDSVQAVGIGDRVLVDTTSLLDPAEGLLVGSAAGFLFHVASEAVGSRFSGPRAFRVNAGAAHSYVLMGDGTTRYLAELQPGDPVLMSRPGASARSVRVGRIKIERRPLVVVTASDGGTKRTVFLQEAETVRLSAESARVPTTELTVGTRVHGVKMPPARHLGRSVEETITER
ncbi:MAG TPA: 3-dehydroquinate synthase II, partial [Thermoplasmata archaeon]|nr:3-dehydroquinate synthase II [Thermoplasmata archaeon]